ncbi:MAG: hypothetical protein R3A48_12295 [Polyangiales bacterium]
MKRWLLPLLPAFSLALLDCGGTVDEITCGPTYFNVEGRTVGVFGVSQDAKRVEAFLQATVDLNYAINDVHDTLVRTCRNIGTAIGVPASAYVAMTPGEAEVTTVCRPVYTEISSIIQAAVPMNARLEVTAQPGVCNVDLQFAAQCNARCTASAMVQVPQCSGQVVAQCSGACSGACSGTCSGRCTGTCMGTCSQMNSSGQCEGTCTGTCAGSCDAACTGECRGSCSVASSVRCEGQWDVMTNAQCSGACDAQARARATCTLPTVTVAASAMGGSQAAQARLATLITALQANLPAFEGIKQRTQVLLAQSSTFLNTVEPALQSAGNVSATAALCSVRAVAVSAAAAAKFSASAQVTVNFTASVSVQGMATP